MNSCVHVFEFVYIFYHYSGRLSPTETKSEKSSLTQLTGFSSGTGGTALGSKRIGSTTSRHRPMPESFVSMKLEKVSL